MKYLKLFKRNLQKPYPQHGFNPILDFTKRSSDGPITVDLKNSLLHLRLNRPEKLNVINMEMVSFLKSIFIAVKANPDISAVLLDAKKSPYFCAGGDVVSLYHEGVPYKGSPINLNPESFDLRKRFFWDEYIVNYLTANLGCPLVSLVQGTNIGGGIGLVGHGKFCMATYEGLFYLPECSIGFFPDVGCGHILSRIEQNIGMAIALCGLKLVSPEAVYYGIATHFSSRETYYMKENLANLASTKQYITPLIYTYFSALSSHILDIPSSIENQSLKYFPKVFSKPTVEEIILNLRRLASTEFECDFFNGLYNQMIKNSPTSLKVTHRYLNMAKTMSLEECLKYEYRIAQNFMRHPDFYEGIRATLIDKDNKPTWTPRYLDLVTEQMVDKFFELPDGCEDLDVVKETEILLKQYDADMKIKSIENNLSLK